MHLIVVKALLYPEYHRKFNTESVRLRRHHRATSLRRRQSICSSSELSQRDSVSNDGCDSSAVSSINFLKYSPSKQSEPSSTGTFVDNGAGVVGDCTREIFASFENMDTASNLGGRVPCVRDSDGSIMFAHAVDCDIGSRDSLQYYSKPVKVVIDRRKTATVNSVVHTSTAQMIIGTKKNDEEIGTIGKSSPSDESEISGYNQRSIRANMACEDLVNLDESLKIKGEKTDLSRKGVTIDERHSMPTLFVGNRFNCSSLTEVFIPSYRDKMDLKYAENSSSQTSELSDKEDDNNRNSNVSTATHSSSIDIPPVIPAPEQLSVELLYNPNGSPPEQSGDVIKPPSMFGANRTLSRELNLKLSKTQNEIQRCMSSQMINLQTDTTDPPHSKPGDKSMSPKMMKKCGCCTESPCFSQRSSDSGMAGSYTIQLTPETPNPNTNSEYDHEQQFLPEIEQRLNGLVHSLSSHDFGRFDNIPFADSNHDSGQYGCNEESENEVQNRDSAAAKNMFELSSSQDTVRRKSRCQSVEPTPTEKKDEQKDAEDAHGIYKTGLYAHWWKKAQLPPAMLNDIIQMKMRKQSNSVAHQSADDSRGSGKISCLSFRRVVFVDFLFNVVCRCARARLTNIIIQCLKAAFYCGHNAFLLDFSHTLSRSLYLSLSAHSYHIIINLKLSIIPLILIYFSKLTLFIHRNQPEPLCDILFHLFFFDKIISIYATFIQHGYSVY